MIFGGLQKTSLSDFPGKIAAVVFTRGCNFRCPYCHNPDLISGIGPTIATEFVIDLLKKRRGQLDALVISGGEPTLHDDLPSFVTEVKALGYAIKLDTNGSRPEMLHRLLDARLIEYVAMDIKAPYLKYPIVTGRTDIADKIRRSVELIRAAEIEYEFRTTTVKPLLTDSDIQTIGRQIAGDGTYILQTYRDHRVLDANALRDAYPFSNEELQLLSQSISESSIVCRARCD
ncbi:MAG: anaerobic ribonucleoside-triphosphate reductase activating protein [Deltaproteobacteria bacterium]|nr:anaerobic ribonucleoside-triphosphate reductase activating protein [Deltaproteobacteria bacterium]